MSHDKPTVSIFPEIQEYAHETSELNVEVRAAYEDCEPEFNFIEDESNQFIQIKIAGTGLWFDSPDEARQFGEYLINCADQGND